MQRFPTAGEEAREINDPLLAAHGDAAGNGRPSDGRRLGGRLTFRIWRQNRDRFTDRAPEVLLAFTLKSCPTPRERTYRPNGYVEKTLSASRLGSLALDSTATRGSYRSVNPHASGRQAASGTTVFTWVVVLSGRLTT